MSPQNWPTLFYLLARLNFWKISFGSFISDPTLLRVPRHIFNTVGLSVPFADLKTILWSSLNGVYYLGQVVSTQQIEGSGVNSLNSAEKVSSNLYKILLVSPVSACISSVVASVSLGKFYYPKPHWRAQSGLYGGVRLFRMGLSLAHYQGWSVKGEENDPR